MAASRNFPDAEALRTRVAAFLATRLPAGEPFCVGLSGGCDSVVLLHLLASLAPADRVSAVHVHHGLSPHADDWADFCRTLCHRLGISLTVCQVTVDRDAPAGLEAAARAARYEAFARLPLRHLFLAQHRGDQAETLLFNLCRGSGVQGLSAMRAERQIGAQRVFRPLLDVPRAALLAYAQAQGLSWVEDESNADPAFSRNYLRHDVLPRLQARFPAIEAVLARTAGHMAESAELLDELAAEDWLRCAGPEGLWLVRLRELSTARLRNLLRWQCRQRGWPAPAASRLDEFVRQLFSAGPDRHPALRLPSGELRVGRGVLRWIALPRNTG